MSIENGERRPDKSIDEIIEKLATALVPGMMFLALYRQHSQLTSLLETFEETPPLSPAHEQMISRIDQEIEDLNTRMDSLQIRIFLGGI